MIGADECRSDSARNRTPVAPVKLHVSAESRWEFAIEPRSGGLQKEPRGPRDAATDHDVIRIPEPREPSGNVSDQIADVAPYCPGLGSARLRSIEHCLRGTSRRAS